MGRRLSFIRFLAGCASRPRTLPDRTSRPRARSPPPECDHLERVALRGRLGNPYDLNRHDGRLHVALKFPAKIAAIASPPEKGDPDHWPRHRVWGAW